METWNLRQPKLEDERRYQNLIALHEVTQEWLASIQPATAAEPYRLSRFVPLELSQNLWLLEKLRIDQLPPELSSMINATSVTDFLDELEETIWIVQMALLENILGSTSGQNKTALYNQLEQITWHLGKNVAEKRWPKFPELYPSASESLPQNIYDALKNSPFFSGPSSFILERLNEKEVSFYWMSSPLDRASLAIHPEVLTLCHLHHHYLRGFLYALVRHLQVEITPASLKDKKVWNIRISKKEN